MKISIRQSVFETNSSSVHSCSITTEKNYKLFNKGKVWIRQQWNDEDEYLPVDEAIERNIEYFKKEIENVSTEEWIKFEKTYRETKSFYEAFQEIDINWDEIKYNLDYDDLFMSNDDYWEFHEYEDWSKKFKDSNGTPMIAWGYVGHD